MTYPIEIAGIKVILTQKKIRNLHLRICPPNAEVKVSAPIRYSLRQIEDFILKKSEWIKKSQAKILKLRDEGKLNLPLKFISGEEHYLFGKKYRLEVLKNTGHNNIIFQDNLVKLLVKDQSNFKEREKLFDDFYRSQLLKTIPDLIVKYEKKMGIFVAEFKIRKMKSRWGSCNFIEKKICFNLELAKKDPKFLEMIVVHEMVHILEKNHNRRFYSFMDAFMPDWKESKLL